MRNIWTIARHEYLINIRRAGFIIFTAAVPVLAGLALLIASLVGGQAASFLEKQFVSTPKVVGVVDHLGAFTPLLPAYQERFRLVSDEETGRAAVESGEIQYLLIVPADYVENGRAVVIGKETGFATSMSDDSSLLRSFFVDHLLGDRLEPALRQRLATPVSVDFVNLKSVDQPAGGTTGMILNMMVPYFLGILLIVTIFSSSGYLLRSVSEEKTSRVIEIVISSVSATELLAGKVIGLGAVGLTQVVIWLVSAVLLSGGAVGLLGISISALMRPEVFILGLVYYLLGFTIYAVLMAAGGALGTTQQESQQLSGYFSMFAALPMMLAGFMFSNPNMLLLRILSWFPLTAPTTMLLRLPMTEVPLVDVVVSIAASLLGIVGLLWAGAKVFRMGLLMYGKRPTLRQIMQTLRQA